MSLALATLTYEWRRYLAAVLALAFSGVLILTLVGLMLSLVQSITSTLVNSRADLVIMPPRVDSMIGSFNILLPRPGVWKPQHKCCRQAFFEGRLGGYRRCRWNCCCGRCCRRNLAR